MYYVGTCVVLVKETYALLTNQARMPLTQFQKGSTDEHILDRSREQEDIVHTETKDVPSSGTLSPVEMVSTKRSN